MKSFVLVSLCLLVTVFSSAQNLTLKSYAPVSPNASGLGIYGDIPVGFYSGTPDISVPVYTIKTNGVNFPIELNYHADGLKVLSEATFVGLDWTLSNGGVITRAINGLDDFSTKGYSNNTAGSKYAGSGIDPEPDVFYYNFNGRIGKFIVDYQNIIRFLRKEDDIQIQVDGNHNFNATTEDGTVYYFTKAENQAQTIVYTGQNGHTENRSATTAWYLTSIATPTGEFVYFNYSNLNIKTVSDYSAAVTSIPTAYNAAPQSACYVANQFQIQNQYTNAHLSYSGMATHSVTDEVLLDNITFNGGKVQFIYSDRIDVSNDMTAGSSVSKKLDQIVVFDINNNPIKNFRFSYGYFDSTNGINDYAINYPKTKRLKLNSFQEYAVGGTAVVNNYTFTYNLPANETFPQKADPNFEPFGYYSSDPALGILSQIKYPTGGSSNFTYEPHDFFANGYSIGGAAYGIRIRKIENRDANNQLLNTRVFEYKETDPVNGIISSGKEMGGAAKAYSATAVSSYNCTVNNIPYYTTIAVDYTVKSQNNMLSLGESINGVPLGYDQVTVYEGPNGENGKSIYYFYNVQDITSTDFNVPGIHDQNNGLLLKKEDYANMGSQTYSLVKRVQFTPTTRSQYAVSGANWSAFNTSYASYHINTQNVVNTKTETWTVSQSGTIDQSATYTYNANYQQPASIVTTASNGDNITTIRRYAYDMVALGQTTPYQNMVSRNMISQLVEEEKQVNGTKVSKQSTAFSQNWPVNANFILAQYEQTQKNTDPVENRIQYLNYDQYGNPTSLSFAGGPAVGYQWGYNGQYVIAQCKGGTNTQFFYEGFENSTASGLSATSPHTGSYCVSQPYTVTWTAPSTPFVSAGYVISYWYRSAGLWKYSGELPYTGTSYALQNGDAYDDIRIYPQGAQMDTYTYYPGVGQSSSTDQKGATTFYEYDAFGRLINAKDFDGNIQKSFVYNFVNQNPIWVDVAGVTRCITDTYGLSTGEQQQEQIDTNPASASYNTYGWRSLGMTGACGVSFSMTNNTFNNYVVSFNGPSNPAFQLYANTSQTPSITPGQYTVTISPMGSPVSHTMIVGNQVATGPGGVFYNVSIVTGGDLVLKIQ
jgi:YD repeat-containing protein